MPRRNDKLHDKDFIYEEYVIKQKTLEQIGIEAGATKHGVYHALKRFNIPARKHSSKYPQLNDKVWLRRMYEEELLSTKQIADLVGTTIGNVGAHLVSMGVELRSSSGGLAVRFPNGRYGSDSPAWRGGVSPINHNIRTSKNYKLWRKAVFEVDNYTCRFCGKRGGDLEADHIKPFAFYPHLRFAIDNGRTLCKPCHRKTETHSKRSKID